MNRKHYVLPARAVSILIFVAALYICQAGKRDELPLPPDIKDITFKEYRLMKENNNPAPSYNNSLASLFPHQPPVPRRPDMNTRKPPPKPAPDIVFAGIIETEKGSIYCFREKAAKKMIFFREGESVNGIEISKIEKDKFVMRSGDRIFTVARR